MFSAWYSTGPFVPFWYTFSPLHLYGTLLYTPLYSAWSVPLITMASRGTTVVHVPPVQPESHTQLASPSQEP